MRARTLIFTVVLVLTFFIMLECYAEYKGFYVRRRMKRLPAHGLTQNIRVCLFLFNRFTWGGSSCKNKEEQGRVPDIAKINEDVKRMEITVRILYLDFPGHE